MITRLWAVAWRAHVTFPVSFWDVGKRMLRLVSSGACRTRCRASMFWEVHPPGVPTVHLRPTSLRKKQTRALCWRKSTSAGRAEWLIQLWSRTLLPTRLDGNNSSLYGTRGPRLGLWHYYCTDTHFSVDIIQRITLRTYRFGCGLMGILKVYGYV